MENKELTREELNDKYIRAFIETRGSVSASRTFSIAACALGLMLPLLSTCIIINEYEILPQWVMTLNKVLYVSVTLFGVYLLGIYTNPYFFYRHQRLPAIMCFCSIHGVCFYFFTFVYIVIATKHDFDVRNIYNYSYLLCGMIGYIGGVLFFIRVMIKRLKVGIPEEVSMSNYLAEPNGGGKIITGYGIVTLSSTIILQLANGAEVALLSVVAVAIVTGFTFYVVESGYAAYLRLKDKNYWEEIIEKPILTPQERFQQRWQWCKSINRLFLFLYVVILVLMKYENRVLNNIWWYDIMILIILWGVKKIVKIFKWLFGTSETKEKE